MFQHGTFVLVLVSCLVRLSCPATVTKTYGGKVFVHMMPWFETKDTNNGQWGSHWTMANQNPDIITNGQRQIASHYYPDIEPYASGDPTVIDYQLLLMKYAGVDGVLIDWPGTIQGYDYAKNVKNSEAIIAGTQRVGLQFGIVYEDHNVQIAFDAKIISNKIAAAQGDMTYLKNNYFSKPNYIQVNGAPLLLDFGPQTFKTPAEWTQVFQPFGQNKPTFLPLWYQLNDAGSQNAQGEYSWIYTDYLDGIKNFYTNHNLNVKIGGAYPGFNTFYAQGGWSGPTWTLPYGTTFDQELQLAIQNNLQYIQLITWNDYGEGTMIEPTKQFGTSYLTTLQSRIGVKPFTGHELDVIKTLFLKRKANASNPTKLQQLQQVFDYLVALQPGQAETLLNTI